MKEQNIVTKARKYLVRELNVKRGEDHRVFSLHYVDISGGKIEIRRFDRERAGYIYLERLTLRESPNGELQEIEQE